MRGTDILHTNGRGGYWNDNATRKIATGGFEIYSEWVPDASDDDAQREKNFAAPKSAEQKNSLRVRDAFNNQITRSNSYIASGNYCESRRDLAQQRKEEDEREKNEVENLNICMKSMTEALSKNDIVMFDLYASRCISLEFFTNQNSYRDFLARNEWKIQELRRAKEFYQKAEESKKLEENIKLMAEALSAKNIDSFDKIAGAALSLLAFEENKNYFNFFLDENKNSIDNLRKEKALTDEVAFLEEIKRETNKALYSNNSLESILNRVSEKKFISDNNQKELQTFISLRTTEPFKKLLTDIVTLEAKDKNSEKMWVKNAINNLFEKDFSEIKGDLVNAPEKIAEIENRLKILDKRKDHFRIAYHSVQSDLVFCKTDSQKERLLTAKYHDVKTQRELNAKPNLLEEFDVLEKQLKYREEIYKIRKEKGSEKEYTWLPFWRNKETSSATAKLNDTRAMLAQVKNLKNALNGKPRNSCDGSAVINKAAKDGELGKLFVRLTELKNKAAPEIERKNERVFEIPALSLY